MSPSSREREREYAKRRYEKWTSKQEERRAAQRRARRNALTAVAAVVAVLLVVGGVLWFTGGGSDSGTSAAGAGPSVSASASPSGAAASPSPSASADAANPCPTPTVKPPATPKSFDAAPAASLAGGKPWTLTLRTTCGAVTVALDGAEAPKAVSSTIFLSREKFWDGSPCHRLTTEGIFVLQCGDPTGTGTGGPGYTYGPVENAPKASGSGEGLYPAGTVAMARASSLTSQGSQFFLVYQDTTLPAGENGYTVIGRITKGLDVVRKVAAGGVDPAAGGGDGKPRRAVSIVSTSVTQG